jgi:hypothetical protein
LAASVVSFYRVYEYRNSKKKLWIYSRYACILFVFGRREEISWATVFNNHSVEYFLDTTNGRNQPAQPGCCGEDLNIQISPGLCFGFDFYLDFGPLAGWKVNGTATWSTCSGFHATRQHIVLCHRYLMIVSIHPVKESELHELSFAFIFFLIFLHPAEIDKGSHVIISIR